MPRKGSTAPSTLLTKETAYAANHHALWAKDEIALVMAGGITDYELAKKLGRSVAAIQHKRSNVKKEKNR
jgi:DNA-binding CsgD family transcriptional regulator